MDLIDFTALREVGSYIDMDDYEMFLLSPGFRKDNETAMLYRDNRTRTEKHNRAKVEDPSAFNRAKQIIEDQPVNSLAQDYSILSHIIATA